MLYMPGAVRDPVQGSTRLESMDPLMEDFRSFQGACVEQHPMPPTSGPQIKAPVGQQNRLWFICVFTARWKIPSHLSGALVPETVCYTQRLGNGMVEELSSPRGITLWGRKGSDEGVPAVSGAGYSRNQSRQE
ncbi:hypothetical protein RRG08_047547 [Elysia crispata]|uniref:Uncharacterized protein n=1 Tax=Elysia crispata TaxID=231223 RepID=A0AAE1D2T0_9GAST|nr:hypothetical protein RRG08_047547 [Elysia crispata]